MTSIPSPAKLRHKNMKSLVQCRPQGIRKRLKAVSGADQGSGGAGRGPSPSKRRSIIRALVYRLQCFPKGTTFRITLIMQYGSAVRLWRRLYGLHRSPSFPCGRPYRPLRRPNRPQRRPSVDMRPLIKKYWIRL